MRFHDKAQSIFADWNLRKETEGKESVISVQEEEAMVEDMRKKKQIKQFNQLISFYNMSNMLAIDIQGGIVSLKLAIANVHWFVFAIYLNGQSHDQIEELLSLMNARNIKKIEDLKGKIKKTKFDGFLSLLNNKDDELEENGLNEPNLHLQAFFENLIRTNKGLRKTLHMLDYILNKAGIDFLSKEAKELMQEAEEQIRYVEDLEGFLSVLKVYRKYLELGLIRKDNLHKPSFLELILGHKKALELTNEEKEESEEQLNRYIAKQN